MISNIRSITYGSDIYILRAWTPADQKELNMQLLMKPEEAAIALGVSRAKCYALITSGELPVVRVGSSWRIPIAALQGWVEAHTVVGAKSATAVEALA
jgi:excisionase family DNA binding protein